MAGSSRLTCGVMGCPAPGPGLTCTCLYAVSRLRKPCGLQGCRRTSLLCHHVFVDTVPRRDEQRCSAWGSWLETCLCSWAQEAQRTPSPGVRLRDTVVIWQTAGKGCQKRERIGYFVDILFELLIQLLLTRQWGQVYLKHHFVLGKVQPHVHRQR
jgi:hypothetical protein